MLKLQDSNVVAFQSETSAAEVSPMAAKPISFGRYLLLHRLNIGGMAEVHLAKTQSIHDIERFIAIKRILPGVADDPEFVRMFIDEAKLSVWLNHANIAQTLELGRMGPTYFIAMEYVSGIDLKQIWEHLANGGYFPIAAIVSIISRLCEGLDYAHRRSDADGRPLGIVHRDISPQNVMVAFDGQVKIIDFGIAKAKIRASRTRIGILKGKFAYMSPEQVAGLELDARSDVFAVGIILYELLTASRLFKSESDFATLEKVRYVELFPPHLLNPKIAPELSQLILRALRRDRSQRIESAEALHEGLMRFAIMHSENCSSRDLENLLQQQFSAAQQRERERFSILSQIKFSDVVQDTSQTEGPHEHDTLHVHVSQQETRVLSSAITSGNMGLPTARSEKGEATRLLDENSIHAVFGESQVELGEKTKIFGAENKGISQQVSLAGQPLPRSRWYESILIWLAVGVAVALIGTAFWFSERIGANAKLSIDAEPHASLILVNGMPVSSSGHLNDYVIPAGDVMIEITAEGYCPLTKQVKLLPHENFSTTVSLMPKSPTGCPIEPP